MEGDNFSTSLRYCIGVAYDAYQTIGHSSSGEVPVGSKLREYVEASIGAPITIKRTPVPGGETPAFRSVEIRFTGNNNHCQIAVAASMRRCWERFVVCKELFQLIVDEKRQTFTVDITNQMVAVLRRWNLSSVSECVEAEVFATYAAFEYLVPHALRPRSVNIDDEDTMMNLAKQFRVPAILVEAFYADGAAFREISHTYHEEVLSKIPPKIG